MSDQKLQEVSAQLAQIQGQLSQANDTALPGHRGIPIHFYILNGLAILLLGACSFVAYYLKDDISGLRAEISLERTERLAAQETAAENLKELLKAQTQTISATMTGEFNTLRAELSGQTATLNGAVSTLEEKLNGSASTMGTQIATLQTEVTTIRSTNVELAATARASSSQLEETRLSLMEAKTALDDAEERFEESTEKTEDVRTRLQSVLTVAKTELSSTVAAATQEIETRTNQAETILDKIARAVTDAENRDIQREATVASRERKSREYLDAYCKERAYEKNVDIHNWVDVDGLPSDAKELLDVLTQMERGTLLVSDACQRAWVVVQFPGTLPDVRVGTVNDFAQSIGATVLYQRPVFSNVASFRSLLKP
ncbi:hypothetical protein [uncultured Tateyamaria sp.]|uniref:hypothetical protein n=1 Tax=uncultured Tateyamaria sp. TaxID=455651 RepID=UPI00260C3A93|nr:hypothetical protein [uncultured Tateyamaria sp.]